MGTISEKVLRTEGLPSPPGVAMRLLEMFNQADIEVSEIATVISTDPVLAAKLINYCNSPLFARTRLTSSVEQAVVAIGARAVKMIGLSFSLMQQAPQSESGFDYDQFWRQSLATALAARTLTGHYGGDKQTFFLLGLMVNVGQLALAHTYGDEYVSVIEQARDRGIALTQMETQHWSVNRFAVAGQLLRHWKFPPAMIDAIVQQSQPEGQEQEANRILEIAMHMSELLFSNGVDADRVEFIKQNAKSKLVLADTAFDGLYDEFALYWNEYASILNIATTETKTFAELLNEARQAVAEIALGVHADNERITEENHKLQGNVFFDSLTGLKNRRAYDEEAAAELERCQRSGSPFVMMVIDLDRFKVLNDQFGHHAGDEVLIRVGQTLTEVMRTYDSLYRFGGEEFVVVLVDCRPSAARLAAERFRASLEELSVEFMGETSRVTASIGVSICTSRSCMLEDVFREADELLYHSKEHGRNRVSFAEDVEGTSEGTGRSRGETSAEAPEPSSDVSSEEGQQSQRPPLDLRASLGL